MHLYNFSQLSPLWEEQCNVWRVTWHSRFKKCLLLSYLKHCASTAPSISIIQRKPHSKGQNYFTDYVYVIMQNKSTISTSKLFLQKLMIMGNNPIVTLQTLHCSSHKGDNCEKLFFYFTTSSPTTKD
jgi:hypothetical protein